ncbi:molybdopterin molybdotransferase MoeA [Cytobacillus gottheilii]|uniref:molybdopterin molybdotransferase MoeA n=1 Tax=Cytobacillus gottheilii TaxID=859144 RepID=UPI0009BA6666|nr:gephyrin-like molybdotransferase Glp [Cytobacillus gottheilii]
MKFFNVKTVEETFQLIKEYYSPIQEWKMVPLEEAVQHILAKDMHAAENVPGFRRSAVDGYAVIAGDTFGASENLPAFLNVTGEVKMGEQPTKPLFSGEALYVPTGGMLPENSSAVIMIEHCEDLDGLLNLYKQVMPGENVIEADEDLRQGNLLLKKGTLLRAQELGALASQGITDVPVVRKPVIAYLSTGNEVKALETKELLPGQVRDMNYMTIGALAKEWGYECKYGGIVHDDFNDLQSRMREMLAEADCLFISGGSSVGIMDYSSDVINSLGKPGVFVHGISIKPGKPTIMACAEGKPVIALPGHPASAMVIFHIFAKKILNQLQGYEGLDSSFLVAKTNRNIPSAAGRTDYVRTRLLQKEGQWLAEPIFGKSGLISTLVNSDGLIEIPARSEGVQKGELVTIKLFL